MYIDACPVLRPPVSTLAVDLGGINLLPERRQQILKGHQSRVIRHLR